MLYQTENRHGGDIYGGIALDFSANVSPLGTPRSVTDAIERALPELYRYPDPYCRTLVQTISEYEGVPKNFVLCGNGASELIYAYCGAVRPKRAMELAPTFSEYSLALRRTGCEVVRFALKQEENFDLRKDFLPFLARERSTRCSSATRTTRRDGSLRTICWKKFCASAARKISRFLSTSAF